MCKCNGWDFWETSLLPFYYPRRESRVTLGVRRGKVYASSRTNRFGRLLVLDAMIKNASASGLLKRIFFPKEGLITVLAAMALFGATSLTHAADASCQVWLVSTRGMPHCGVPDPTLEGISYWRWDEECRWSSADAEQFQAADDASVPTVVYIHGNRTDADYAVIGGWYVYRFIKAAAGVAPFAS